MKTVMPENGVGASHVHHTLTALPYKIGLRRISRKYYPPKYTPFEPCCPPFGHGMDRSTNGHFWKDYAGAAFNDKGGDLNRSTQHTLRTSPLAFDIARSCEGVR